MNRPPPQVPPDIPPAANQLEVNTNPPTKAEVSKAMKSLKSDKAAGPDGIPPEALKGDVQTSTEMIHPLLMKIWESEQIPEEWRKGYLVKLPKKGDLSSCNNWRGIMLLSVPSKILTRIILERLKKALDETLREEPRHVFAKTDPAQLPHCELSWSSRWNGRPHCTQYSRLPKGIQCGSTSSGGSQHCFPPKFTVHHYSNGTTTPAAKSYTTGSWRTHSRYRPVFVKAAYCRRPSSFW